MTIQQVNQAPSKKVLPTNDQNLPLLYVQVLAQDKFVDLEKKEFKGNGNHPFSIRVLKLSYRNCPECKSPKNAHRYKLQDVKLQPFTIAIEKPLFVRTIYACRACGGVFTDEELQERE